MKPRKTAVNGICLYIPGIQMTLVLVGKDLLLVAKQRTNRFQVYIIYIYMCVYINT